MINGFMWLTIAITVIFFLAFLVLFVCDWIIYFLVEHTVIESKEDGTSDR